MTMQRSSLREELDQLAVDTYDDDLTDREIAEALIRLAEQVETEGTDRTNGGHDA